MSPFLFQIFNVTFIAGFQMALIYGFCAPIHLASLQASLEGNKMTGIESLTTLDFVAAAAFCVLLVGESVADAQMLAFQNDKMQRKKEGKLNAANILTLHLFEVIKNKVR